MVQTAGLVNAAETVKLEQNKLSSHVLVTEAELVGKSATGPHAKVFDDVAAENEEQLTIRARQPGAARSGTASETSQLEQRASELQSQFAYLQNLWRVESEAERPAEADRNAGAVGDVEIGDKQGFQEEADEAALEPLVFAEMEAADEPDSEEELEALLDTSRARARKSQQTLAMNVRAMEEAAL